MSTAAEQEWFFTFGSQYSHEPHPTIPQVTDRSFLRVAGMGYEEARAYVHQVTGGCWSFQYSAEEFAGQPQQYGLVELVLGPEHDQQHGRTEEE